MGNGDGDRFDDEVGGVFAFNFRSALADRILPTNFLIEFPIALPTDFFFGGNVCVCIDHEMEGGELKRVF